jgi:hypothetical protein
MALHLMGELMELDHARFLLSSGTASDVSNLDTFIDDGVFSYESVLAFIHGEAPGYARGTNRWLKFARKSRKKIGKDTGLVRTGRGPLLPRETDLPYLNRTHPHLSFTGNSELQAKAAAIRAEAEEAT